MNNENLTVHFKVKDFNTWRTSYNGHEKDRASAGITNGRVFRSPDDPNAWPSRRWTPQRPGPLKCARQYVMLAI